MNITTHTEPKQKQFVEAKKAIKASQAMLSTR